jgi:hypothetical protein
MADTHRLDIGYSCWLEYTDWKGTDWSETDVSLMYIEHASDSWYSDSETEKFIDESKAKEIVEFLRGRFPNI